MGMRAILWQTMPEMLLNAYATATKLRHPDRIFIKNAIVPAIIKHASPRVIDIGVHYYTRQVHKALAKGGAELHTADIDERKLIWGVSGRHTICGADDLHLHLPNACFDFVILNGVLGYGIDDVVSREKAFRSIERILAPKGTLIIGWDDNMSEDPFGDEFFTHTFQRTQDFLEPRRYTFHTGLRDQNGRKAFKHFDFVEKQEPSFAAQS